MTVPVFATSYVDEPDIPAGLTISEYRRSRPRRISLWQRVSPGAGNAKPGTRS
jgi:hypothetical protein